ncbi:hypothetical protein [Flavobacterium gawalongense]|uniref:Uncharacterized protein n=2 Tax=Flavobacterium gawalongense TaxID=2594432 RepID=A0A553BK05_9FLAO|nr:hypothetical protein [Flavobacterium gawalongense]TRX08436.1 hypothetical protein FNW12_04120 [Flavobacterium gawalongense]TRX08569.1 hypothetical protein FNW11_10970 [Flavobacterium gawalongense]TRX09552.1 hypothetical protein FNW10_10855 [Flavobacterium gawalongense]TRX25561.1 hypothetical protein FNW38_10830 [Flavobacterium gawalongense]
MKKLYLSLTLIFCLQITYSQDTINNLKEVIVPTSKKILKKQKIGSFNRTTIEYYFGAGTSPWIVARYYPFEKEYQKTPFIKILTLLTESNLKNALFNIRLYSVGEDGEPKNYIYNENIFDRAKKGNNLTKVDISKLKIRFPEEGIFVAIEWLIIDENKYEFISNDLGQNKESKRISYEPNIGTIPVDEDKFSWIYRNGKWKKALIDTITKKYNLMAIELTLTN